VRAALSGLGALAAGGLAWGWFEAGWVRLRTLEVPLPGLPPELDGLRIAHVTDLHLPCAAADRAAEVLEAEGVDLVLITGDTISSRRRLPLVTPMIARLRGRFGTFAVRGNNDHWSHVPLPTLSSAYAAAGAHLIENGSVTVTYNGAALQIVGVDDPGVGHPDVAAAWRRAEATLPTIWLVHAPGFIDRIDPQKLHLPRALLVLAGHTHGGQIRGPGCTPVVPRGSGRFRQGWYDAALGPVYISRGIGTSILPLRFLCPPELPILTLRRRVT
jgi:uncharacterized protein